MIRFYQFLFITSLFFAGLKADAQQLVRVKGVVYDSSRVYPLEAVSVLSNSGKGTVTDINGAYELDLYDNDSIWFSYLNKATMKFAVAKMNTPMQFDISLQVNIPVLKEVKIRQRNYRLDSIRNREEYEKVFNWRRPNAGSMTSMGPGGAGIDIQELIRAFQFRRNRSMEAFQQRLLQQERDKFIDHRFNKNLVRRLTGLNGAELDSFMLMYRPTYELTLYTSDYQFQEYIKLAYEEYKGEMKKEGTE